MNKRGTLYFSAGLIIRTLAGFIIMVSLPFLIANPANPIAQGIFAFGNFLMVIGANIE